MRITRRDFLRYCTVSVAALGLSVSDLAKLEKALALETGPKVIWLQGSSCSGCSTSLLNSIYYTTIDDLLINTIDLQYHPTVMAAAGDLAVSAATSIYPTGGFILAVEGAVPTSESGKYCTVGKLVPGSTTETFQYVLTKYANKAKYILAVGTCAAFGGIPAGAPSPTGAKGVKNSLTVSADKGKVINLPGCSVHPDWIVGTIAYIIANGKAPSLNKNYSPVDYYMEGCIHSKCPRKGGPPATQLGDYDKTKCLEPLGCRGQGTKADCPVRMWNSPAKNTYGVNWCIGSGDPCHGCVEPTFPDGMSPFYKV